MFRIIDNRALIPGDLQHKKEELHQYVNHFKDEKSGKINYEGLVQDLNQFDYMTAQHGDQPGTGASMRSGVTDALDYQVPRSIFDDDYVVLDQNKVP